MEGKAMYQDWKQWARLAYSCLLLGVVWALVQPDMMEAWAYWGMNAGLVQVSLFTISAGLLFPKARKLEPTGNDGMQFAAGLLLSAVAWAMSLL
jgi:hypothetical protein